ncbi:MAG TPA: hypothetical protein VFO62_00900 [Candidatus Binatia bacterium]|nr:hypothetical protein [Candidatus Binatia bacterium]
MLKSFVVALLSIVVLGATALAQGVSIYAPVQPLYKIGAFDYRAPTVDGWRQVTSSESGFVLVYAEHVPPDQINTRLQVEAESFAVPDPKMVPGLVWLTEQGQAQQVKERGEKLVAFSKIAPIGANDKVLSYALVTRIGEEELHEIFYVTLAPDKTSYLVAKMTTKEPDYRQQVYLSQFEASLASLVHNPSSPSGSEKGPPPIPPDSPKGT